MNSDSFPFQLLDDPTAFHDPQAVVVRVPAGLRAKQKVLGVLADGLRFPRYFGYNWDALEESLRDLAWLKPPRVVIVHADLPFGSGENRAIYLQVLANVIAHWQGSDKCQFAVIFPTEVWAEMEPLLA